MQNICNEGLVRTSQTNMYGHRSKHNREMCNNSTLNAPGKGTLSTYTLLCNFRPIGVCLPTIAGLIAARMWLYSSVLQVWQAV